MACVLVLSLLAVVVGSRGVEYIVVVRVLRCRFISTSPSVKTVPQATVLSGTSTKPKLLTSLLRSLSHVQYLCLLAQCVMWLLNYTVQCKLSALPSVTQRYYFSPSGSHIILVFPYQTDGNIPTGTDVTGPSNADGVWKNRDFRPVSHYRLHMHYSGMSLRMISSDLEWLSEIFDDTKHRAASLQQLASCVNLYSFVIVSFNLLVYCCYFWYKFGSSLKANSNSNNNARLNHKYYQLSLFSYK